MAVDLATVAFFISMSSRRPQHQCARSLYERLQVKSGIVLPPGISLALKEPQRGAADNFLPMLNWLDDQIRISLLVPGLIGASAEQAVGSLARSGTEFTTFTLIIDELRRELTTLLNERLVKPLIDLNFQVSNGRYARFAFKDLTDSKKAAIFDMWLKAVAGGTVTKRGTDEQRLRQLAGFDPVSEDEVDEVDTELETARTDKGNQSFFAAETQKRVYEHARDKKFVLRLAVTNKK